MPLSIDITGSCGNCQDYLDKWSEWIEEHSKFNMALLEVVSEHDYHYNVLDSKSRNMIRKCDRSGYTFKDFIWNRHLDEIHDINNSKEVRSGGSMTAAYKNYPTQSGQFDNCPQHHIIYYGGFLRERLKAYCVLAVVNELAIIVKILGHADSLKDGVMNGLVNGLVDRCRITPARYINYLSLESSPDGLALFKRSVGFKSEMVVVA